MLNDDDDDDVTITAALQAEGQGMKAPHEPQSC